MIKINLDSKELREKLNIKDGKDGKDGLNGKDGTNGIDGLDGKDAVVDTAYIALEASKLNEVKLKNLLLDIPPELVRNPLETLRDDERLDKSAIRGLDDYDEVSKLAREVRGSTTVIAGAKSLQQVTDVGNTTTNSIEVGGLTTPYVQFDTNVTPITNTEGLLQWNATDGTLDLGMSGGDIAMQVGQEMFTKVRNQSGSTILNGKAVYFSGRLGNRPLINLALANAEATSMVAGVTTQDITSPSDGFITTMGYVRGIKTNYTGTGDWGTTWVEGDLLYVSKTVAGQLTNVEPTSPHHSDIVGSVGIVHSSLGSILIDIDRHRTLEELADINGTPLTTTGQFPSWNQTAGYFDFDKNITNYILSSTAASTYVPYTGANADVDLGSHNFSLTGNITFGTGATRTIKLTNATSGAGNILAITGANGFDSTGGGIQITSGAGATGATQNDGGTMLFTSGLGGNNTSTSNFTRGGAGGAYTFAAGQGGVHTGNSVGVRFGGTGGLFSITSGIGGASTGTGPQGVGGDGGNITMTTAVGGRSSNATNNACGTSGSIGVSTANGLATVLSSAETPGNSGGITYQTGAGGASTSLTGVNGASSGGISFSIGLGGNAGNGGTGGSTGAFIFNPNQLRAGDSIIAGASNNTGGVGGAIGFNAFRGGDAFNSTAINTGGAAGAITFLGAQGGNGGSAAVTNTTSIGGLGTVISLTAGNGGDASGKTTGTLTPGIGGSINLTAGNSGSQTVSGSLVNNWVSGGNVNITAGSSSAAANQQSSGGNVYIIGGAKGAAGGTNGNIILGVNAAGTIRGNVGVGVTSANVSAKTHIVATTEQLRVGYDTSNYYSTTVGSTGLVTFDAVGSGSEFLFSDRVRQPGTYAGVHFHDASTAQSIATGTTYTKLTTFTDNDPASNATSDATNDKVTITKAGKYLLTWHMSFSADTNNVLWFIAPFLNGVELNNTHQSSFLSTGSDQRCVSASGIITATANQDVDLRVRHDNGSSVNITPTYGSLTISYLGE